MKKLFLLVFLMTISLGQSQTRLGFEIGESGGGGGTFGGANVALGTGTGSNTSRVLTVSGTVDQIWQGVNLLLTTPVRLTTTKAMTIDVISSVPITFLVKVNAGTGPNSAAEVTHNGDGTWQTLPINFNTGITRDGHSGTANGDYTNFVIHTYWVAGATGFGGPQDLRVFSVDNISGPAAPLNPSITGFTVPAKIVGDGQFVLTAPTSNSAGAFTYTSSNTAVATISGSTVTILGGGTSTITANQAADGDYNTGSATASLVVSFPAPSASPVPPARNAWDVVSLFTGTPSTYANVSATAGRATWSNGQLSVPANGTDTALQIDNLGFVGYTANTADTANFPVTGMTTAHFDIYLDTPISFMFIVLLDTADRLYNTGPLVAGWNSLDIPLTSFPIGAPGTVRGFKFEQVAGPPRRIFVDNIYFYRTATTQPPTFSSTFTVASPKTVGDATFQLTAPTSNSGGAFTFTSSNTAVATIAGTTVTIVGAGTSIITATQAADGGFGSGIATATLDVTPGSAPAAPTRNTWDVVSLYSGAYTNIPSASWQGASTLTDVVLQGNAAKKMSNFNVEIINFAATDVSAMTMLHMDIYTPDSPSFNIWLLNNGDRNAQIFPAINGWRSIDIPLSTYVNKGLNMSGISFLKFESLSGGGKTVYVDNVYFYRPATLFPATVGTFTVPAKTQGDPIFTLTPPTSNNIKPFTYTSSNTAVARIVNGNQVSIISGGTSTITASQVADGNVGPTSRTAPLVVTFLSPGPSPTPPALDPSGVVSMYTGTPTTFANACNMVRSDWTAGTTMTSISNGTNTALKIDNFGYIGLVNQGEVRFSAAGMTTMHIDIYLNTPLSNMFVVFLAPNDILYNTGALKAGWNSLNISLSNWGGADLTQIRGFKLEQNVAPNTQIYVDNMYFWNNKITQLRPSLCGKTLSSLNTAIQASPLVGATEYTFEVTRTDNSVVDIVVSPNYYFFPATLITNGLVYGKSYSVRVKAKINNVYELYGVTCVFNAPAEPLTNTLTKIRPMQCGKTMNYITDAIQASPVYGAVRYEFDVTDGVTSLVIPSNTSWFRLSQFPGGGVLETAYTIRVRSSNAPAPEAFTAWGDPCVVSTPIARLSEEANDVFEVKSFPNPFASHFTLDIESTSDAQVEMKVYDMIGRQLEVRKASVSELSVLEIGRNYPTGIYNLVVSQGEKVKSLRMIKR